MTQPLRGWGVECDSTVARRAPGKLGAQVSQAWTNVELEKRTTTCGISTCYRKGAELSLTANGEAVSGNGGAVSGNGEAATRKVPSCLLPGTV